MAGPAALTAFMSYSHADETLRLELAKHLATLRRQGVLKVWYDREIHAGSELDAEIRRNLEAADIILLLVSADFIHSDYCYGVELQRAMERHRAGEARVIPVILRPCDWQPVLGTLMATPIDGRPVTSFANRDEGFLQVAQALRKVAEDIARRGASAIRQDKSTGADAPTLPATTKVKVRRTITDRDRAKVLVETFSTILQVFKVSAGAAVADNPGLEIDIRQVDADHFTAGAYIDGRQVATCKIWHSPGDRHGGEIRFSYELHRDDNSWNESISIANASDRLALEPLGMQFGVQPKSKELDPQQAAEYLWQLFIAPLAD